MSENVLRKTTMQGMVNKKPFEGDVYLFWCPGCKTHMWFAPDTWTWNGDMVKPDVNPSILTQGGGTCHLYVRHGTLQFLGDCSHELAGQTVPMEPLHWGEDVSGKVEPLAKE